MRLGSGVQPSFCREVNTELIAARHCGSGDVGFAVTYIADEDYDDPVDEPEEKPKGRALVRLVVTLMLAGVGSGSALLWRSYGLALPAIPSSTAVAAAAAPVAEKPLGVADLQALQQQVAGSMQSTEKLLAAQQAEIKRLSDQLAALSGKLDLLQRPVTSAQAALPPPAPKPVAPTLRRKPAAQQPPAGAISTGGAPLPPPVPLTR
jgi:uncharacterized coiled-coil protein SlyX